MTELTPDDAFDASLVVRARDGDDAAFAALVRRHQARSLRLAYSICGSKMEAEDAVQDAMVRAHAALHHVRVESAVRPWLMSIVANTARNRRRASSRRERAIPESNMPGFPWLAERALDPAATQSKMQALQKIGVPYTTADIESATETVRDRTEMDALIAYMQGLKYRGEAVTAAATDSSSQSSSGGQP
jgi:RNA polymerase sigma factor (sigma-70 family)